MNANVSELVREWDDALLRTHGNEAFEKVYERLLFSALHSFGQYLPTVSSERMPFEQRLASWIGALASHGNCQRILLELAERLIFLSREDFDKLHHAALVGPVSRWLIDLQALTFNAPDFDTRLKEAVHDSTWYCGLSDSMAIADFHHVNNIGGVDYRPDVRSLARFSSADTVVKFMQSHKRGNHACPLRGLVVLEDFIGSGSQLSDAARLIEDICKGGVPCLLLPLIICPEGDTLARDLVARCGGKLRYEPLLSLRAEEFVTPGVVVGESKFRTNVRRLVHATYSAVKGTGTGVRPYSPFGFRDTGALVVMFSNTPANTLSLVQHESDTWQPLFPRSARVR